MNGSLRHTLDSEPRPPRSARPHPVPATNADSSASNARPTYDGDPLPPQPSSSASESPFTVVDEPASSRVHVRPFTPADPDNSDDDGTNTADSASSPTNEATQRQESVSAKDEDTTEANSEEVNTFSTSTVFIRYEDLREALRLVPPL